MMRNNDLHFSLVRRSLRLPPYVGRSINWPFLAVWGTVIAFWISVLWWALR